MSCGPFWPHGADGLARTRPPPSDQPTPNDVGRLALRDRPHCGSARLSAPHLSVFRSAPFRTVAHVESPAVALVPLADGTFVPGATDSGMTKETVPLEPHRFDGATLTVGTEVTARRLTRLASFTLDSATLARFAGQYSRGATITLKDDTLTMAFAGGSSSRLVPVSPSRFLGNFGAPVVVEFVAHAGKVVALRAPDVGFTAERLPDK